MYSHIMTLQNFTRFTRISGRAVQQHLAGARGAWRKGIIVKLPKKGNLSDCNNWPGITLLSTPGKVFTRVLLNRLQNSVDQTLRDEQAGFRKGRSCTEQIFAPEISSNRV